MTLEVLAPAKLNLALEVTARRPDGYHELVTIMQTIDVVDSVRLEVSDSLELRLAGEELSGVPREGPRNLAFAAAQALAQACGRVAAGALIELEKRIPVSMGLGGGSTDAAAVLRGLNRLWQLDWPEESLIEIGAQVGSDVPFFLTGGTALVTGRGERLEPLPDLQETDFVLFLQRMDIQDKTRRMYASLSREDFTDGRRARVLAESVRQGVPLSETDQVNAFDVHVAAVAESQAKAMAICRDRGVAVHAAGSGPGFFSSISLSDVPPLLREELRHDWGVELRACRSLTRSATRELREF